MSVRKAQLLVTEFTYELLLQAVIAATYYSLVIIDYKVAVYSLCGVENKLLPLLSHMSIEQSHIVGVCITIKKKKHVVVL